MLSHRNIVANILQCLPFEGDYLRPTATQPRGTLLLPLPFFHIFGLSSGMLVPLYVGGRLVFMPSFDLKQYLEIIQKYKVTRGFVVPPIVLALAKHPMIDDYDLSSLQCLMSGIYSDILSTHPIKASYQHILSTYLLNTPYQHTISTHPIQTSYQRTLSRHPVNIPINISSQRTLSNHPINTTYHQLSHTHQPTHIPRSCPTRKCCSNCC